MCEHDETVESLQDVLLRNGFVRCDIAACNCGSWHPRYGLQERWNEVRDALTEAGYLGNYNGNLVLNGVRELIQKCGERSEDIEKLLETLADIATSKDMTLAIAQSKARRIYVVMRERYAHFGTGEHHG